MYNLKGVNRSVYRSVSRPPIKLSLALNFFLKIYTADFQGLLNKTNIYFVIFVIIKLTF